mmetsp:Transcript_16637/g.45018  ORF Transcript_16637/g.45018 Transcript_16637/m.45018 type:complete len:222 (+) Transcript_16637:83-748(+)
MDAVRWLYWGNRCDDRLSVGEPGGPSGVLPTGGVHPFGGFDNREFECRETRCTSACPPGTLSHGLGPVGAAWHHCRHLSRWRAVRRGPNVSAQRHPRRVPAVWHCVGLRCVLGLSDPGVTAPGCRELCSFSKNVRGLSNVRGHACCHFRLDSMALQGLHELRPCWECLRICIRVWLCACLRGCLWGSRAGWFAGGTVAGVSRGHGRSVLLPCLQSWHVCMS